MTDELRDIPEHGDHMPIGEFIEAVRLRLFTDYDGFGEFATADKVSDESFCPSHIEELKSNWTHVVWYNK